MYEPVASRTLRFQFVLRTGWNSFSKDSVEPALPYIPLISAIPDKTAVQQVSDAQLALHPSPGRCHQWTRTNLLVPVDQCCAADVQNTVAAGVPLFVQQVPDRAASNSIALGTSVGYNIGHYETEGCGADVAGYQPYPFHEEDYYK